MDTTVRYDAPTGEYRFDEATPRKVPTMHVMPDGDTVENPDRVYCDSHRGEHNAQPGCANAEPSEPETGHTMDTATAMQQVRQAFQTVYALQPFDGRAGVTGTTLTVSQWDGTAERWQYQHAAGGTMRVVRTSLEGLVEMSRVVTPLETNRALTDHLRSVMVEVLR